MIWRLLITVCLTGILFRNVSASDPDIVPPESPPFQEDPEIAGGERSWDAGDWFVVIGVTVGVALLFILPRIYDGGEGRLNATSQFCEQRFLEMGNSVHVGWRFDYMLARYPGLCGRIPVGKYGLVEH